MSPRWVLAPVAAGLGDAHRCPSQPRSPISIASSSPRPMACRYFRFTGKCYQLGSSFVALTIRFHLPAPKAQWRLVGMRWGEEGVAMFRASVVCVLSVASAGYKSLSPPISLGIPPSLWFGDRSLTLSSSQSTGIDSVAIPSCAILLDPL